MPSTFAIASKSKALNIYSANEGHSARIEITASSGGDELVISHDDGLKPVFIPGSLVLLDGSTRVDVATKLTSISGSVLTEKNRALVVEQLLRPISPPKLLPAMLLILPSIQQSSPKPPEPHPLKLH
jgi:hypothetical protein